MGPAILFTTNYTINDDVNKTMLIISTTNVNFSGNYTLTIVLTDNSSCSNSKSYYKFTITLYNVFVVNTTNTTIVPNVTGPVVNVTEEYYFNGFIDTISYLGYV